MIWTQLGLWVSASQSSELNEASASWSPCWLWVLRSAPCPASTCLPACGAASAVLRFWRMVRTERTGSEAPESPERSRIGLRGVIWEGSRALGGRKTERWAKVWSVQAGELEPHPSRAAGAPWSKLTGCWDAQPCEAASLRAVCLCRRLCAEGSAALA